MRPVKHRLLDKSAGLGKLIDEPEYINASVRGQVDQPFGVIKRQFGHLKVRYLRLAKDSAQLKTLFPLSTLWMVLKNLLALDVRLRPNLAAGA